MAGNDDNDPIVVIGSADGPHSLCSLYHLRLFTIAPSLAVWYLLESLPCLFLEVSTMDREWDIEVFSLSLEVFGEFLHCLFEDFAFRSSPYRGG